MAFKKIALMAIIGGVSVGLVGCGAKKNGALDPYTDSSEGIKSVQGFYGEEMSSEEELGYLNKKIIYFAYDSSELTTNDTRLLMVHAKYLLDHPKLMLRLAGHTDERGSREYNIALGERRAKAAARFLESRGVPSSRLIIVSYGKEQPIDNGSNEQAWAQNRRVGLEYEDMN